MATPESSDNEELQQSLTRLHGQLSGSPTLDEKSRLLLREVVTDIERLLTPGTQAAEAVSVQPSRSRLEQLAASFEAGHPTLSASLRELIDLLGRAGL